LLHHESSPSLSWARLGNGHEGELVHVPHDVGEDGELVEDGIVEVLPEPEELLLAESVEAVHLAAFAVAS